MTTMGSGGDGRRVVLVAPEFPPANTAGAHRPRLFAKHLPEFGWTPTVLTIRRDTSSRRPCPPP